MVQQLVLLGQVLVVVLLYVLVWRVVRTARNDLRDAESGFAPAGAGGSHSHSGAGTPDQSTIIPASAARAARAKAGNAAVRLIVESSSVLRAGIPFTISSGLSIGRDPGNDIVLSEPVVSGKHARLMEPATLEDLSSTNGTTVNGSALVGRIRLSPGDRVAIGSTVFRVEVTPR